MKGANALLAILILLMSVSTCEDTSENVICDLDVHLHFSTTNDHGHVEDICTPFCSCACCSIPISNSEYAVAEFNDSKTPNVDAIIELESPQLSFKIWQPPKI